jgi:hypothetical protein
VDSSDEIYIDCSYRKLRVEKGVEDEVRLK